MLHVWDIYLQNWVIFKANVGKYSSTMVRIWVMFSHIHPFLWPLPRLGYLAGVVLKVDEARFARALWRAARGNTFAWHGGTGCGVGDGP